MRCWLHAGGRKHNISSLCVIINLRFEFEGGGRLPPSVTTEEKSRGDRAASGGGGLQQSSRGAVLVHVTCFGVILAGLLTWRSQKSLRGHLSHICELHRWHTKGSTGLAWRGGRD